MEKSFFSKNLSTYLFANRLTNQAIGEKVGITSQAVSKWLTTGRPPGVDMVTQLAGIMGVSIDELLHHDLTYRLILDSGYSDLAITETGDVYGKEAEMVRDLVTHIESIQARMQEIVDDNRRVLRAVRG